MRPALQRLAAVVAVAGRVRELCAKDLCRGQDSYLWAREVDAALNGKDPS